MGAELSLDPTICYSIYVMTMAIRFLLRSLSFLWKVHCSNVTSWLYGLTSAEIVVPGVSMKTSVFAIAVEFL